MKYLLPLMLLGSCSVFNEQEWGQDVRTQREYWGEQKEEAFELYNEDLPPTPKGPATVPK